MDQRDVVMTINVVEPALVRAVKLQSEALGRELKGLVLVHEQYASQEDRPRDDTGLFTEIICDFNDKDALQAVLEPYQDRLLVATCRYEEAIQPFAQVIPFLPNLNTPTPESLHNSSDKSKMRKAISNYDASLVPRFQYLEEDDLDNLEQLVSEFHYPVIVKPSGLSKSLLVTRCDTDDELKKCLDKTFGIIHDIYDREQYPGRKGVLVEEMMQGNMYSTDAYVMPDGEIFCLPLVKVVTAHSVGLSGFYGYHRSVPSGLPETDVDRAFEAAKSAIRALKLSSTTAHVEMFQTTQGWKIIEVAARMGGYRDALYREVYGNEHFYNDLSIRMGNKPTLPGDARRHANVLNMYADKEGEIDKIIGLEQAGEIASIVSLASHAKSGDIALFSGNGGNPVVDAILSNEDKEQLEKDTAKVRELVKIHIKS